ncbi:FtsW/RodA/SpoVE family cell cycle protein, partial [Lysobacter sp. 2RAB21]
GLTLPMISYGGSSVVMSCAALAVLLRVSYELDRAQRQVARLRGEATQPAAGAPATAHPIPSAAANSARGNDAARGTSRLRERVEPTLGRSA